MEHNKASILSILFCRFRNRWGLDERVAKEIAFNSIL